MIKIFPVCYSDMSFVNSSPETNIYMYFKNRKIKCSKFLDIYGIMVGHRTRIDLML